MRENNAFTQYGFLVVSLDLSISSPAIRTWDRISLGGSLSYPYPFDGMLFTMNASSSALFVWAFKFPVCCGPMFLRLVFVLQVLRLWPSPIWDAWDSCLVGLPSLFRLEIYQWITMFSGVRVTTLLTVDKICQVAQNCSFPHRLSNCQLGMVAIFFLITW